MNLSADSVKRVREAYSEATGAPVSPEAFAAAFNLPPSGEQDGVSGAAALALRYLSQGLPGFRGKLREWSFQGLVGHHGPHQVLCRFWWPRFNAEIGFVRAVSIISHVHWIDDPGGQRIAILREACRMFRLALPEPDGS